MEKSKNKGGKMKTETKTLIKESFLNTLNLMFIGAFGLFVLGIGAFLLKLVYEESIYYLFPLTLYFFLVVWGLIFLLEKNAPTY